MRALGITPRTRLRQVDHRAIIAWERMQREQEGAAASTVRRRLAALSSLFKHLVRHGAANRNPVVDVERPAINRDEGSTAAFSKAQARKILDAPPADTLAGLRDRAIWGHQTICPKSYAKRPCRSPLPFGTVLKEGYEREIPRNCRPCPLHAQTSVCESH